MNQANTITPDRVPVTPDGPSKPSDGGQERDFSKAVLAVTRMEKIAERRGRQLTSGLIYYYFTDKESAVPGVLEQTCKHITRRTNAQPDHDAD
jgi:hypothetical protein